MERSRGRLLEVDVNFLLAGKLRSDRLLVLQHVRIHPCEMDIVALDRASLKLVNIEIKRRDWKALLRQSLRGKLYCHYSIAALPQSMKPSIPAAEFEARGVGLLFFEESISGLNVELTVPPMPSRDINRSLKRVLYCQFIQEYGDIAYA